ncbi:MAG TPA: hypothetical protein VJH03_11450 [Blastocatellia bacterium]|nr:hypothetical protein [Blastocatellia bacterium]
MGSDDLTKNLTDDKTTQPTMQALLERINQIGELVTRRMDELEESHKAGLAELSAKVDELRREMDQGFRRLERIIGLLNNDFLRIRGDHEDLLSRVELLETKAS